MNQKNNQNKNCLTRYLTKLVSASLFVSAFFIVFLFLSNFSNSDNFDNSNSFSHSGNFINSKNTGIVANFIHLTSEIFGTSSACAQQPQRPGQVLLQEIMKEALRIHMENEMDNASRPANRFPNAGPGHPLSPDRPVPGHQVPGRPVPGHPVPGQVVVPSPGHPPVLIEPGKNPILIDPNQYSAGLDVLMFELLEYHFQSDRLDYFLNHFKRISPLYEKYGMQVLAWLTPVDRTDTVYLLLVHENENASLRNWARLKNDPQWRAAERTVKSLGNIGFDVYSHPMFAASFSPEFPLDYYETARVFELKRLQVPVNNLNAAHKLYNNSIKNLFRQYKIGQIAYWDNYESLNDSANTAFSNVYAEKDPFFDESEGEYQTPETANFIVFLAYDSLNDWSEKTRKVQKNPVWTQGHKNIERELQSPLTLPGGETRELLIPTDFSPLH